MTDKLLVLLLGSNLGDRSGMLFQASSLIAEKIGPVHSQSSVYESAPWGFDSVHGFLNQCITVRTDMEPGIILERIKRIEVRLGRKNPSMDYADRLIDIDILFYGDLVLSLPDLQIPHTRLQDRRFSLLPLAEIMPDFKHPVLKKTIRTLLSECADRLPVERFKAD
jgi:2-amino-4-hydroxy-6-hydroxymethyldihydropteridine diphosphokinase